MSYSDTGAILEALNDKMDRDAHNTQSPADIVIEKQDPSAANDYTWYRKYSDGWVEQGGYTEVGDDALVSVTLLVPMNDANYSVSFGNRSPTYTGSSFGTPTCVSKTTTTFSIGGQSNGAAANTDWQVRGIAG